VGEGEGGEGKSMKEIQLSQGKVALVDDEDFESLNAFKWSALRCKDTFYAVRYVGTTDGRRVGELMHRVVLSRKIGRPLAKCEEADHEHGDGFDNRRENLRLATHAQNMRNCRRHSENPSSRFLGVWLEASTRKWRAGIRILGKSIHIGIYATEMAAALGRESYIVAHPELMARSNFPVQTVIKKD
jgi:hypothetical protein